MNITKEYLTGLSASAIIERHCQTSPFISKLGLQLLRFGHRSALFHIFHSIGLSDANGKVDPGVLVATMNAAVSMIAKSSVPDPLVWSVKEFSLIQVATERVGTLALLAESEDLNWAFPGRKVLKVSVYLDRVGIAFEPIYLGEVVLEVAESGTSILNSAQPVDNFI